MEITLALKQNILNAFNKLGVSLNVDDIVIEHSKDPLHGDYATNAAMKNCKLLRMPPVEVAKQLVEKIDKEGIEKIEIAGPGFINFFMKKDSLQPIVKKVIEQGDEYGKGEDKHFKVNVEFVSANPTGDLHVGHARGAAIGDSICRIMAFAGYDITREYYINDAGNQIDHLAESILSRYKELLGIPNEFPEDGYHGQDIYYVAQKIIDEVGDKLLKEKDPIPFLKERGMAIELDKIRNDLNLFRVSFDIFSSELKVRAGGAVEKELQFLDKYIYEDGDAKVLRTTDFLDDKDRVIVKSNGDYTYFMPDIVYHVNKISRGYDQLIDVLGADHHGYINRMKSALMMHGYKAEALEVELIQMVKFIKDGVEVKASKRTGDSITLKEICEEVGVDAMRYFFAMRASTAHMDFDMNLALEQSSNNPVYYAQYAHARLCSILEQGKDIGLDLSASKLEKPSEMALLKHIANFPNVVNDAAKERAPYKITNYIHDLAGLIHEFYTECRVIDRDNAAVSSSRLALCRASEQVMKNALNLIGVSAPEHM